MAQILDDVPVEIWQKIVNWCDPLSQIIICQVSKFFNTKIHVTDLYHFKENLLNQLNDEIIQKYPFVEELDASGNDKITNVSNLRYLKKLNASRRCGISDTGVVGLDLVELNASDNPKITNVVFGNIICRRKLWDW